MNLDKIDPALKLMKEFAKVSGNTVPSIQKLREEQIFKDGVIAAKTKTLMALLLALNERCEPCLKFYALKAKELGVTKEELGEALAVASTMGGCVGEMWALKAFKAYLDNSDESNSEECCN